MAKTMELGDRGPEPAEGKDPSADEQQESGPPATRDEPEARASVPHEPTEMAALPPAEAPEARRTSQPAAVRRGDGTPGEARARPRYLLVALIAALVFGAGCWTEGCARLAFYRGEREHYEAQNQSISDDGDRGQAEQLYQRYLDAADATRGRGVPLAAATFVLGAALLALAARGLAGRSNTRSALMQVVAAQAIVVAATYFTTRDMRRAEDDWQYQTALLQRRDKIPAEQYAEVAGTLNALKRWAPPAWLTVRSLASALIILALSRPRSRAFFDAAAQPISER